MSVDIGSFLKVDCVDGACFVGILRRVLIGVDPRAVQRASIIVEEEVGEAARPFRANSRIGYGSIHLWCDEIAFITELPNTGKWVETLEIGDEVVVRKTNEYACTYEDKRGVVYRITELGIVCVRTGERDVYAFLPDGSERICPGTIAKRSATTRLLCRAG